MEKSTQRTIGGVGLLLLLIGAYLSLASQPVQAGPHPGQSVNVAIIGSPVVINGGTLPTSGPAGELGDFTFTNLAPAAVNAANLAPFDTAVLNVASPGMSCNVNTLTPSQQADLVAFVGAGKKLIIYDSECSPQNYSWLPFPFTTANPGALGATGTLTIVEENTLSSNNPLNPHFIDAANLSTSTDAVGDMNVMTTFDPNWCVDMSGTNAINVTGPVHTYANFPAGTDTGLFLYNGLDQDFQGFNSNMRKIWVQELQQPFDPSGLPCRVTVVGITLAPATASNTVGQTHTVTATLTDLLGNPQPGVLVTFSVTSGPNAGATGTCSSNANCTTDANGQVSFTYTGSGGVGTDDIHACFTNQAGQQRCSQVVTKEWTNQPPDCSAAGANPSELWPPNHKGVPVNIVGVTDPDGDVVSITIDSISQDEPVLETGTGSGNTCPDAAGVGTDTAQVRSERAGNPKVPGDGRVYHIAFTADDDMGGTCTGEVAVCVPHDQRPGHVCVDQGPLFDSTVCP